MSLGVLLIVLSIFVSIEAQTCDPTSEVVISTTLGSDVGIVCVNFKTGETRSVLKISGFVGYGLLTVYEDMLLYSVHVGKFGMDSAAFTYAFSDKSLSVTGPGLNLKDYVTNWVDLFYDIEKGSIYAVVDLPNNGGYTRSIFKYDTPKSQTFTSIVNITLPCSPFCLQTTENPISAYNPKNQTYWLITTGGSYESYMIEVDLEKGVVNYMYENSISGYFGYSGLKYNPKDDALYGILPNTTVNTLLETVLVRIEGRSITKILELDLPKNLTVSDGQNLPAYVDIDFENNLIFCAYTNQSIPDHITINVLDFDTGNLLNRFVVQTNDFIWAFSLVNRNKTKFILNKI